MSAKLQFLQSHLDVFQKNWGDLSEEQGERFHQDICDMEECYQGWWDVNFVVDYCWCLKWDTVVAKHRRKSLRRLFIHKQLLLSIFQFAMALCELSINTSALNLVSFV